jgi:hypothetical protein
LHIPSRGVKRRRRNYTGKKSIRGGISPVVFFTVFNFTVLSLDVAHKAASLRKADGFVLGRGPPPRRLAVLQTLL